MRGTRRTMDVRARPAFGDIDRDLDDPQAGAFGAQDQLGVEEILAETTHLRDRRDRGADHRLHPVGVRDLQAEQDPEEQREPGGHELPMSGPFVVSACGALRTDHDRGRVGIAERGSRDIEESKVVEIDVEGDDDDTACTDETGVQGRAVVGDGQFDDDDFGVLVGETMGNRRGVVGRAVLAYDDLEGASAGPEPVDHVADRRLEERRLVECRHHDAQLELGFIAGLRRTSCGFILRPSNAALRQAKDRASGLRLPAHVSRRSRNGNDGPAEVSWHAARTRISRPEPSNAPVDDTARGSPSTKASIGAPASRVQSA